MFKSNTTYLLVLLLGFVASTTPVSAGRLSDSTATIRLNIQTQETSQPQGIWRRALSYLGIRKDVSQYPQPGTGITVHSTAYAPSPYQTDSTPCITAAGTRVRPGVVATNFLPFGTLVQIGNEVYIVEDRMNPRYQHSIDIFFPSTQEALDFGSQKIDIIILGYGEPGQPLPREELPESSSEEQIESIESQSPPSLKERLIGRINHWQRIASDLVGIRSNNVNRYDVDCFS
jgi:3D (Asp-Asp-Asp) domain-containing protein